MLIDAVLNALDMLKGDFSSLFQERILDSLNCWRRFVLYFEVYALIDWFYYFYNFSFVFLDLLTNDLVIVLKKGEEAPKIEGSLLCISLPGLITL